MTLGLAFWILMLVWLILGAVGYYRSPAVAWPLVGGNVIIFALIAILGWKVFGPPIHG